MDMVCIHCGNKTQVVNSRLQKRANQIWRRRQCLKCKAVFTTQEAPSHASAWLVKQNQDYQSFLPEKLLISLHRSLQHRQDAVQAAVELNRTIINKLGPMTQDGLLEANKITQVALVVLNRFDKAASTNYAAYHQLH